MAKAKSHRTAGEQAPIGESEDVRSSFLLSSFKFVEHIGCATRDARESDPDSPSIRSLQPTGQLERGTIKIYDVCFMGHASG